MNETPEKKVVTGLAQAHDRKEAEYDLVKSLLSAAEFKTDEECITEVELWRNGAYLFTVHLRPLGDPEIRQARKRATTYMPNPAGKKLPKIEKEFDDTLFNSWAIYLATTEDDQSKVWGNPAVMQKYHLALPAESIDVLLTAGEKRRLVDTVQQISGMDEAESPEDNEQADLEEYAGN